ncbi:hypothetical protein BEWA_022770 [Theileria equi strain WA]|uniref:Uncharacterized protein n=1 Tax=Theileria equi strain WA TaxID=1537102 RepID=L0AX26_THEEQ|nr:hypothetical protein BEWA_022770 [Theileria equi strain WA]AFZ79429.1 hypothetical protein BEWA_022770 [Theileria equi strain WA]|eukprot:XP_004829095.1 hypothetical protein BEWA_022770 [Theileria equi strain WA]
MAQLYTSWFEKWLKTYVDDEPFQDVSNVESQLFGDYSSANSPSEVALEVYNALRGTDLSLDQLCNYIHQIGTIISQTDLRALATQPRSMYNQMFSVIFDTKDGENTLLECHKEDSFAHVYLMVRLLYEILLFTKSTAVRSFAYHEILRNREVLCCLFGIVHKPCTVSEGTMSIDVVEASILDAPPLTNDPLLDKSLKDLKHGQVEYDKNPLNTIGFPPSNYFVGIFDTLFLQMLQSKDLNLRMTGLSLMAISPTIVANNPQILSEMLINMVGDDDELSFASSVSMAEVLPLLPQEVAMDFLRQSFTNALQNKENSERIQAFISLSLGCTGLDNVATLAHRMLWMLWGAIKDLDSPIMREQECYLLVASTLLSRGDLVPRQKLRLESLLYGKDQKADSDMVEELAYCLNLMYTTSESTKENVRDSLKLYNVLLAHSSETQGKGSLLYQLVVHQLAVFEQFGDFFLFKHSIKTLPSLLAYDIDNITILSYIQSAFSKLGTSHTRFFLKIIEALQPYLNTSPESKGKVMDEDTEFRVYSILSNLLRQCYICDLEGFKQNLGKINEAITCSDLKLLIRPLVQIQNIEKSLVCKKQNFLVQLFYDIITNESQLHDSFKSAPLYIDFVSNKVYKGKGTFKISVYKQKTGWGVEYKRILSSQVIKFGDTTSGKEAYKLIQVCLRFGLYKEAIQYIKVASLWVDSTLLWFNALHHHSMAELEQSPLSSIKYRKQCIESLESLHTRDILAIQRKMNSELWNYGLNYLLPYPLLHTWSLVQLVLETAVAHFGNILAGNGPKVDLTTIFISLKMQYKVLGWLFRSRCHETRSILGVYEGLAIILASIAKASGLNSDSPEHHSVEDVNEAFKNYLHTIYPDAQVPFTLDIISMLSKRLHAHLSCTRFLCHKIPFQGNAKDDAPAILDTMDRFDVPLETIWQELVINYRCKFGQDEIGYHLRDIPSLGDLYNILTTVKGKATRTKKFLEAIKAQIPTPIGIAKAYPLPFAAIVATFFSKKRKSYQVQTIKFEGSIRNCKTDQSFSHVRIKMDAVIDGKVQTILEETFRLLDNVLNHTSLVKMPKDVKSVKLVALPLGKGYTPAGVPCDVYIAHKVLV